MRLLDHLFFPDFKKQEIRAPIYIIGNPRSGTTFTHRLLALDRQFTFLKLYHTIFPSILCYRFFSLTGKLDSLMGSPARRLIACLCDRGFKGWETIHRTGPEKAESDEMFFMYAFQSPLLALLFPFISEMDSATLVDFMSEETKKKLMAYYRSCLQRHIYATGPDKILLQKVALIAGRIDTIHSLLPDMRIVHLVRNPAQSIPSLISMFEVTWKALTPHMLKDGKPCKELADLICTYYLHLHEVEKDLPPERLLKVRYEDLVSDPRATAHAIYSSFDIELRPDYDALLIKETRKARKYKSRHTYSLEKYGLTEEQLRNRLQPIYDEFGFGRNG